MKYLMRVKFSYEQGNNLLRDPEFGKKMHDILQEIKAEAVYFTTIDGVRGFYGVVNMDDASQMPAIAEPLFVWLNAKIDFYPVMLQEDLAKAGASIAAANKKWG